MTTEKPKKFKRCMYTTLATYSIISFAYVGLVALNSTDNTSTEISDFAAILTKNLAVIFIFSVVLGYSSLIFSAKNLPGAAKWTIHVCILLASTILTFLATSGVSDDPNTKIKFIIIAVLLFAVVYSLSVLVVYLIKRKRR